MDSGLEVGRVSRGEVPANGLCKQSFDDPAEVPNSIWTGRQPPSHADPAGRELSPRAGVVKAMGCVSGCSGKGDFGMVAAQVLHGSGL